MKTKLRFLSLLLAIVMCFSMLAACSDDKETGKKNSEKTEETKENGETKKPFVKVDPNKDPYGAVAGAFTLLGDDYAGGLSEISEIFAKVAEGTGSYDFEMETDGTEIGFSAVVDSNKGEASAEVKAGYEGFSAKANLWLGDDIVLQIPALLGDGAYGVKLSTIEEDLEGSPLLEAMGFDSVEDMKDDFRDEVGIGIDDFAEIFGSLLDGEANKKAAEKFTKALAEAARGVEAETEAQKIGDKDGYKITFNFTPESAKPFVEAYFDYYKTMYASILELSGADIDDALEDALDSLDEAEGESVPFIFYIYKDSGKLAGIEFANSESHEDEYSSYTSDESLKLEFTDGEIKLTVINNHESEYSKSADETTLTYKTVNKNGKTGFEIEGKNKSSYTDEEDDEYSYDYVENISASFIRDKDGKFTFSGKTDGEDVFTVKGTLKYDKKSLTLGISSIVADGEDVDFECNLTVKAGGKVEKTPKYTNIFSMSESDFEELAETVQNSVLYKEIEEMMNAQNQFDDEYFDDEYYDDEYFDDEYYDDEYYDDEYYDDEYFDDEYFDDEYSDDEYYDDEYYF